jgi:tyrosine-protein kinase Etk/Wzc
VLRKASTSRVPISPVKPIIYGSFITIGVIISILLIAIRYLLNNDIAGVHDLSRLMNPRISLLVAVPKYSKNIPLAQLIIDKNPKSVMAEAFRTLRSNLDFFQSDNEKKVIAVTSTISGEGKTFDAINLGGILAFSNKKVIILDLDMRKPRIHKGFNSTNEYGMSTYLSNRDQLKDIIRKSELDGLHFITAGPIPPNPSELIISGNLTKGLEELKKIYDIIIIDNPPVGLVTDGIASLKLADYPIYVFRSEYSKKSFVDNINRIFIENKITNLTAVLNSVDLNRARYGSYGRGYGAKYGYGYGYGYGYTSGKGYYANDN